MVIFTVIFTSNLQSYKIINTQEFCEDTKRSYKRTHYVKRLERVSQLKTETRMLPFLAIRQCPAF